MRAGAAQVRFAVVQVPSHAALGDLHGDKDGAAHLRAGDRATLRDHAHVHELTVVTK